MHDTWRNLALKCFRYPVFVHTKNDNISPITVLVTIISSKRGTKNKRNKKVSESGTKTINHKSELFPWSISMSIGSI